MHLLSPQFSRYFSAGVILWFLLGMCLVSGERHAHLGGGKQHTHGHSHHHGHHHSGHSHSHHHTSEEEETSEVTMHIHYCWMGWNFSLAENHESDDENSLQERHVHAKNQSQTETMLLCADSIIHQLLLSLLLSTGLFEQNELICFGQNQVWTLYLFGLGRDRDAPLLPPPEAVMHKENLNHFFMS